ncbi:hypothetical protein PUNSTDRAFT_117262 [Punctularia strigosozonata HHB-11173 SS5]|uniref:uncharacterized protein n=1 Tax=Punctularia strigosozonata (strain HHB-11173) TaxID=741275 RepID=UPI0004417CDF|nr:uncharacterized protein PUNSTDRAFT_117262 [Punctularia strigosozonata HHB-11173 SS5]EIN13504.1 hypothetical protein PUNSTDRAFT_117262 [Punctularia strigosozonata HHB-11173 SS5]
MIISAPDDTVRDLKDDASIISTGTVSSSKSSSEQLQRARLAKLSRHLGEAIPEELVLKPVVAAVPSTSSKPAEASRRQVTASRPRRPRPARRMSLDLTSLIKSSTASTAAAIPTPAINATRWGLTRSKSLFTGKAETRRTLPARQPLSTVFNQQSSSDVKLEAPAAASIETTSHEPLSERDRALNVKRARKMAQLFGSDPPPALFQITNLHGVRDDALLTPLSKRGSLATFVSTEEGLLTPVQGTNGNKRASWHSQTSAERKRASLITFVSSASAEDALLLAPLDAKRSSSLHSADSKRASVITFISTLDEVPERTAASPRDLAAGHANSFFSLTIDTQAASAHVPSFDDPPASAPFANTIPLAGAAAAAAAAEKSSLSRANTLGSLSGRSSRSLRRSAESSSSSAAPAPTEAWALRRRAAKLSQFFGVEYNDLDPARVRPASPPPPVPPIPARPLEIPAPPDSPPLVDVEVQHVGRRWGVIPSASRDRVQDMNDVRNRLRQMRAAS